VSNCLRASAAAAFQKALAAVGKPECADDLMALAKLVAEEADNLRMLSEAIMPTGITDAPPPIGAANKINQGEAS